VVCFPGKGDPQMPPTEAAYFAMRAMARAQSRSGSRSPSLANRMITFATVIVAGSSRSVSLSLVRQVSNAVINAVASSGENE
jgi:hypothetical protein